MKCVICGCRFKAYKNHKKQWTCSVLCRREYDFLRKHTDGYMRRACEITRMWRSKNPERAREAARVWEANNREYKKRQNAEYSAREDVKERRRNRLAAAWIALRVLEKFGFKPEEIGNV